MNRAGTTTWVEPPAPRAELLYEPIERLLAEVLAGVLQYPDIPPDSHFFDELGADSLLMAQFCARLRRRGGPSVSMREVYAHPTLRRLAAAVHSAAATARPTVRRAAPAPAEAPAGRGRILLCGALQGLFYLGYTYLALLAGIQGFQLLVGEAQGSERLLRLVLFASAAFVVAGAVPIAAKWLLVGRWTARRMRLWSLDHLRLWIVKTLLWSNPVVHLLIGSPLYGPYLRALGARIGPRAVIQSHHVPVCTDLLSIGADAVVRREVAMLCYRAQAGGLETGPVQIGERAWIGEMTVLEIDSAVGDGAQLGHSSALLRGQRVPAGERWHGSPAQPTRTDHRRAGEWPGSDWRRSLYAISQLVGILLVCAPLLEGGLGLLYLAVAAQAEALDPTLRSAAGVLGTRGLLLEGLAFATLLFFGLLLLGLLLTGLVPRLLSPLVPPERDLPLYGLRWSAHCLIAALGRQKFLTVLFGDSSYIVHFLGWTGMRLRPLVQTGSNFGSEVVARQPRLSSVGRGTMVADGLSLINDDVSSTAFRVSGTTIGPRNFIGNYVGYPAGGRTADDCLLAIKVMVPLDGPLRRGVGLLGSPPFEIPRSVERDSRFDHLRSGPALAAALAAKNRFNLHTMVLFLLTRWLGVYLIVLIDLAAIEWFFETWAHALMALLFALSAFVAAVYFALVARAFEAIGPAPPALCSIYHRDFWWVERLWKLHPIRLFHLFDGTPFKSLIWRLMGVRIGRGVFDDGVHISEPLLTRIGDGCVLNHNSKIQCDSQEDGTYKSGPAELGAHCTLGVGAFVHYGVRLGDGAVLAADAFLMKGEEMPAGAHWAGNPAREN